MTHVAITAPKLEGTPSQIEWAERIRLLVDGDFDRVARMLRIAAEQQCSPDSGETRELIEILEEKRREVMAQSQAGYFIRDWQEITDQVRLLIQKDPRYAAIKQLKKDRTVDRNKSDELNKES